MTETCPRCGNEAYRVVETGEYTRVDTIGTHMICATNSGFYMHGYDSYEMSEHDDPVM